LTNSDGKVIYTAVSDVNGMAYLLYDLDNTKETVGHIVVGGTRYDISAQDQTVVNLASAGVSATKLDLLFMVDTTGSMGDELSYLQAELRDVIRKVAEAGQVYAINLSVNFYRDTGDEYVVRSFEFTSDIDKAISQLSEQSPNGGGDYAEAVHLALEDVVNNHQWRDGAVKLCFMVLDAPPHTDREIKGIDDRMQTTVMTMAERGIRFIPLASSGVDTETEFLLRSWAVMTGGTYTFLTNHSGIGNSHLEPTIGEYEVEKLNDLLVRVICEYCGIK
jgi:Mg-chelatase subunit ChlD